jgi:hypothetical protein
MPPDEKTGLVVCYGLKDATASRGDHRRAGRHRFDRCTAERFVPDGREHEHIRVVIVIDQFRPRQKTLKSNLASEISRELVFRKVRYVS